MKTNHNITPGYWQKLSLMATALLILLLLNFRVQAQQNPQYSMFMFNALAFNPAVAGSHDEVSTSLLFRKQWVSFPGSPQTGNLNIHSPLKNDKIGLGLSIINDRIGAFNQNGANLAYAYHLPFEKFRLSLGLQAAFNNFSLNLSQIRTSPNQTVDNAFASNISVFSVNFGTGAYLYGKNFFAGVSVPHLLNSGLEKKQVADPVLARQAQHFYAMGGYVYKINPVLTFKPSLLIRGVKGAPLNFDINSMMYFYDVFGIGAAYRSFDSVDLMAEVIISPAFRLAYAFDQTVSGLQKYNSGSHEIVLQYRFGFNKNKVTTPRYF
jgi:type IX secretion system PorP/SprF family membrane protein